MADASSQETVRKLKELLFEREATELSTLTQRMAELQQRAGSDELFRKAVADVLDRALLDAEKSRHRELTNALSPMVIRTFRAEMASPHTQDQIAGIMYPRMGEMVSKYVASAFRDMMNEINRRLESGLTQNRAVLWLRSVSSGRSMAELALADTQRLEVDEIYLVKRGSGEMVDHYEKGNISDASANRDTLVSGFFAAITAFAEDAFEADRESLRTLELDDFRIYIRGAPDVILAVKCRGTAPAGVDQILDAELIRVLGAYHGADKLSDAGASPDDRLLPDLATRIEAAASERTAAASSGHSGRVLKGLLWLIGLPLAALLGWYLYVSYITGDLQARAEATLAAIPGLKGYPVKVHVERGGRRIWMTGLTPDDAVRREAIGQIKALAPEATLEDALGLLPNTDIDAKVGADAQRRARDRATRQLAALTAAVSAERQVATLEAERTLLADVEASVRTTLGELEALPPDDAEGQRLGQFAAQGTRRLRPLAARLAELASAPDAVPQERSASEPAERAEALTLLSTQMASLLDRLAQRRAVTPFEQRIDAVSAAARERSEEVDRIASERLTALNRQLEARIVDLERRLAETKPTPIGADQRLLAFVRTHAVFFSNDTEFRQPDVAARTFDDLAALLRESGLGIRVVGYTDEIGSSTRNSPLAQARADKVAAELGRRGITANQMTAVGRLNAVSLGSVSGPSSPNRRVEFEVAFVGEKGDRP